MHCTISKLVCMSSSESLTIARFDTNLPNADSPNFLIVSDNADRPIFSEMLDSQESHKWDFF